MRLSTLINIARFNGEILKKDGTRGVTKSYAQMILTVEMKKPFQRSHENIFRQIPLYQGGHQNN
jgi:hypothetical protein